jgi:hypothetical protein
MTWPHVIVMQCAVMEPTSPAPASGSLVAERGHASPDCPALMACSPLMTEGASTDTMTDAQTPSHVVAAAAALSPTCAVLTADPPPPRRPP